MNKKILILLAFAFLLSCNVQFEKRRYNRGFFVQYWGHKNAKSEKEVAQKPTHKTKIESQSYSSQNPNELKSKVPLIYNLDETNKLIKSEVISYKELKIPHHVFYKKNKVSENSEPIIFNKKNITSSTSISKVSKTKQAYFAKKNKNADKYLYTLATLMGLSAFGLFRANLTKSLKVTRWANENKLKTKATIAFSQIGLAVIGVAAGKHLNGLGYDLSNNLEYFFAGLTGLSFLNLLINKKNGKMMLFDSFYMRKISHLMIGVSLLASSVGIGNRIADERSQIFVLGNTIEHIDASYFNNGNSSTETIKTMDGGTVGLIVGYALLSLLLLLILFVLSCAAFCAGGAAAGIPVTIASIVLLAFVIKAMVKSIEKSKGNGTPKVKAAS